MGGHTGGTFALYDPFTPKPETSHEEPLKSLPLYIGDHTS